MTTKAKDCPFCDFGSQYEYNQNDHFQYGVDEDAVMLLARVVVIACTRCSEKWTDFRSEDTRQAAVEKHLATLGVYLCGICREAPVDVSQGVDTCDRCFGRV
jgi:hypothetical protein